ncbi:hypothetical protein N7510_003973 [Penicillium lagena]|uniref:uncharacterized protein n=1 Tax=Penicillium lagena TaxID=94218 RepID=UPI00254103A7|nr:uncharacterized protein N7510_003973 [Penicillium lagena]KAJ5619989.1 hypothetical protein N7510_003973 [Penicillium lagena]
MFVPIPRKRSKLGYDIAPFALLRFYSSEMSTRGKFAFKMTREKHENSFEQSIARATDILSEV